MGPDTRLNGVRSAAPVVERFIDERIGRTSVPAHRVIICGFSQGAMIALYIGLRRETPPAAIISHSALDSFRADECEPVHIPKAAH